MNTHHRLLSFLIFVLASLLLVLTACGEDPTVIECQTQTCEEMGYACGVHTDDCGNEVICATCDADHDCQQGQCIFLSLTERLDALDGVQYQKMNSHEPGTEAYLIFLDQPEDHAAPEQQHFQQRLVLIHRDDNAPMVLHTLGYGLGLFGHDLAAATEHLTEPTRLLSANELLVEHRFFGESISRDADWEKLNIWQSANDSHRIVETFSDMYRQPWIGTGVSKGGMTAIFHHRFFPDDLAGIVPYVAPVTFGFDDPRYQSHMADIGPSDGVCRRRVEDMSREFIERRDEATDLVEDSTAQANTVDRETLEALVASRGVSFNNGFWQRWGSTRVCQHLPHAGAPMETLIEWFIPEPANLFYIRGFEPTVGPYRYQVANELGEPFYTRPHLDGVLDDIDFGLLDQFSAGPPPWGEEPDFEPQAMLDVDEFLRHQASRVLAVYGAWDPWTAAKITLNDQGDNARFIGPGLNHSARFADLPSDLRQEAVAMLTRWAHPDDHEAQALITAKARDLPLTWDTEGHQRLVEKISNVERQMELQRLLIQR